MGALIQLLRLLTLARRLDPDPEFPLVLESGDYDFAEEPFMKATSECYDVDVDEEDD